MFESFNNKFQVNLKKLFISLRGKIKSLLTHGYLLLNFPYRYQCWPKGSLKKGFKGNTASILSSATDERFKTSEATFPLWLASLKWCGDAAHEEESFSAGEKRILVIYLSKSSSRTKVYTHSCISKSPALKNLKYRRVVLQIVLKSVKKV